MNKYQEALNVLKKIEGENNYKRIGLFNHTQCDTLQELIDKSTPKKVDKVFADFTGEYGEKISTNEYCPCCKEEITNVGGSYCHICGQKLDWEVEDD